MLAEIVQIWTKSAKHWQNVDQMRPDSADAAQDWPKLAKQLPKVDKMRSKARKLCRFRANLGAHRANAGDQLHDDLSHVPTHRWDVDHEAVRPWPARSSLGPKFA